MLRLRIAVIHPEDFGGKQRGFVTARPGADFEHHVLVVVGIFGQQHDLELVFDRRHQRLQPHDLFIGDLPHLGSGIAGHRTGLLKLARRLLPFAELLHDLGQVGIRLGCLAVLVAVTDDGGVGELLRQLFEAFFGLNQTGKELHGLPNELPLRRSPTDRPAPFPASWPDRAPGWRLRFVGWTAAWW